jgi:hypothetical protein
MILTMLLSLPLLGQAVLPGSALSLEQAQEKSHIIVVAKSTRYEMVSGAGACAVMVGLELRPSIILKGTVKVEDLKGISAMAISAEVLPKVAEEHIFLLDEFAGHLNVVKMLPKTEANIEALKKEIKAKKKE